MRGKVLSILSLVLVACANQSPSSPVAGGGSEQIVNGVDVTTPDTYSQHTVYLEMRLAQGGAACTGSILDSETILTAAHCIAGAKQAVIIFATNAQDPKNISKENVRVVDVAAINPKFVPEEEDDDGGSPQNEGDAHIAEAPKQPKIPPVPTLDQVERVLAASTDVDYDIALLHFKGGLPTGYSPVKLAKSASIIQPGATLQMIGYGLAKVNSSLQVDQNGQPVIVPVPDQTTVGQLRETAVPIAEYATNVGMILSDGHATGVCNGDSGGPGFMQDPTTGEVVQVAIAEAVANQYCNSVSMHTAIFPFLDWISSTASAIAKQSNALPKAQLAMLKF